MLYRLRARILWVVARLVAAGLFQSLEVQGRPTNRAGPRLVISNHFNGLVDVVLLIAALGEYPQFLAKSSLFDRLPSRLLLKAVGAIPVYRPMDGADGANNVGSFDQVYEAWEKGRTIAIFPEGTVAEEERLQPLRTGAARMALGAVQRGIDQLAVIPVGITYMDKAATRSRGLVEIGQPIVVATLTPQPTLAASTSSLSTPVAGDLDDTSTVRFFTKILEETLGSLSAAYGSLQRKARLLRTADVVLSTDVAHPYDSPPMTDLIEMADEIASLPDETQAEILNRMGMYHLDLVNLGVRDDHLVPSVRLRDLFRKFAITVLTLIVVTPLAYFTLLTNVIPILLTVLVGTAVREPVTKGTARVLMALLAFPSAWAFTLWTSQLVGWQVVLEGVLLALGSILVVIGAHSVVDALDAGLGWWRAWSRADMVSKLLVTRADAVGYVRSVLR